VIAAKAARMHCIAVPDPALRNDRRLQAADLILPSLAEFHLGLLEQL
jgi:beta-phosphoglucomutase-like phosphatase (HAD superfamily)